MALIDKETIRAEIERRYYRYGGGVMVMAEDAVDATMLELEDLLAFLDTLPEQPVTDCHDFEQGLEEEIARYLREECSSDDEPSVSEIARHFAEWGAEEGRRLALENMRE